jgi:DNA end-binding protein Ku
MRPIWKGQISFGLINIPIELYSAETPTEVKFKLLDKRNKAKIHYQRINDETGKEVPWQDIVKAYEYHKNDYVVLEDEDFKQAAVENSQTFEIADFVASKDVDCSYFEKPYYLVPGKGGQKGYVLLREILKKMQCIAIGKVVIRTRQYLAALLPRGDALMLNTIRFAEEVKDISAFNIPKGTVKDYKISSKEFTMAEKLVAAMMVAWQPEKYHDDYEAALMRWIEKKAKQGGIPIPPKKPAKLGKKGEVIDFMELLKKSLQAKGTEKPKRKQRASR